MKNIKILVVLLLTGCVSTPPEIDTYEFTDSYKFASEFEYSVTQDYQEFHEQSQIQAKTKVGWKYFNTSLLPKHNEHWKIYAPKCYTRYGEDIEPFKMVVAISEEGRVLGLRTSKDSDTFNCLKSEIEAVLYPSPPFKSFYFYLVVNPKI